MPAPAVPAQGAGDPAGAEAAQPILAVQVADSGPARVSADASLDASDGVPTYSASVEEAGFRFALVPEGEGLAAALVGTEGACGEAAVPAEVAFDGLVYPVARITAGAVKGDFLVSLAVPATVASIDDGAFAGAPYLESIQVAEGNLRYSSYDGMLFDADLTSLLLIPGGKQGAARIPTSAEEVPASAFSHSAQVASISVEAGSAAFSSWNGCLYDASGETLLRVPAGLGNVAEAAPGCTAVAAGAFEGCDILSSVTGLPEGVRVVGDGSAVDPGAAQQRLADLMSPDFEAPSSPVVGSAIVGLAPMEEEPMAVVLGAASVASEAGEGALPAEGALPSKRSGQLSVLAVLDPMDAVPGASAGVALDVAAAGIEQEAMDDVADGGQRVLASSPEGIEEGVDALDGPFYDATLQSDEPEGFPAELSRAGTLAAPAAYAIDYVLNRNPYQPYASTGWPEGYEPPSSLGPADGDVAIPDPVRRGYRFVGWANEAALVERIAAGHSVIHAANLEGDVNLVARWSAALEVDVPLSVTFSQERHFLDQAVEGVVDAGRASIRNLSGECDLRVVGMESRSRGAEAIASADPSVGDDEAARALKLVSVYPVSEGADGIGSVRDSHAASFGLDDVLDEAYFRSKDPSAFVVPKGDGQGSPGELGLGFRLNLGNVVEGQRSFARIDSEVVREGSPVALAEVSYAFATVASLAGPDSFRVSFHANGGAFPDGDQDKECQVPNSDATVAPADPAREGHDFLGWASSRFDAEEGRVLSRLPQATVSDAEYWAAWAKRTYIMTWDGNGGDPSSCTTRVRHGSRVSAPSVRFVRAGYSFEGWASSPDAREPLGSLGTASGDATYYAVWSPIVYAISYDLAGGSASGNPSSYTIESPSFTLQNPIRAGYEFAGWSVTGALGAGVAVDGVSSTVLQGTYGEMSFTARWRLIAYTVSYDLAGGSASGNPSSYTVESPSFTLKNPTRTGYTFAGWSGTGLSGSANKSVTVPKGSTGNRSYTAHWAVIAYTVTWKANGGNWSGSTADKTTRVTYGSATTAPVSPARTGYTFKGWSTTSSGSVTALPSSTTKAATYYAVWALNSYTMTWNPNGGNWSGSTASKTTTVSHGSAISAYATAPIRSGYVFKGWAASSTATTPITSFGTASSAKTYYAVWGGIAPTGSKSDVFWFENTDSRNGPTGVYGWADIKAAAKDLAAYAADPTRSAYYKLYSKMLGKHGDEGFHLKLGWSTSLYDVVLLGICDDKLADGSGRAGLTFIFEDAFGEPDEMYSGGVNTGNWSGSEIRARLNGSALTAFPAGMQAELKTVSKVSQKAGSRGLDRSNDKMFLISYGEYFGTGTSGSYEKYIPDETEEMITIYKGARMLTAEVHHVSGPTGNNVTWWTRSGMVNIKDDFIAYNYFSTDSSSPWSPTNYSADARIYLRPCFAI